MALLVLAYAQIQTTLSGAPVWREIAVSFVFSAATVISMLDPIVLLPHIPTDLRMVMILLAGPFGGPLAVLACGATAIAFRTLEGGPALLSGLVSIAIGILTALAFASRMRRMPHELRARHFLGLGLLSGLSLASALFLPGEHQLPFLTGPAIPIVLATVLSVMLLGTLLTREVRRIRAEDQVRYFARTDSLTGLPNRRALEEELARAFSRAKSHGEPLTLVFMDIDHFKLVNDRLGHDAGDRVLAGITDLLRRMMRTGDFAARYGGEEFVLLLQNTSVTGGAQQAERIRNEIECTPIAFREGSLKVTSSFGVAATNDAMDQPSQILNLADEALLQAKAAGRNRVQVADNAKTHSTFGLRKIVQSMRGDRAARGDQSRADSGGRRPAEASMPTPSVASGGSRGA